MKDTYAYETVLVIDFGSRKSQDVARMIRKQHVYSEVFSYTKVLEAINEKSPKGIVLCEEGNADLVASLEKKAEELGIPVLKTTEELDLDALNTSEAEQTVKDFLFVRCGVQASWTMSAFVEKATDDIRKQVGDGKVICGLSGGVDSAVTALLVHKAVGDQLTCIFVDHGLMRLGEPEEVVKTFRDRFNLNIVHVDASERFLALLEGVTDPEQKRKIIGTEFIRVFEEEAKKIGDAKFLAQGTIYPDVIESGIDSKGTIKSHHNVGGLPEDMKLDLVEPLRLLFKDEVREVGLELGMPENLVYRHPFPGPGLAVRVIGEITKERLDILRQADAIYIDEIRKHGLYNEIWQAFCILTDTRTVGVSGGERTYAYMLGLRAVNSTDAMTAEWYPFPHDVLQKISSRILQEVPQVNRVVYDVSSKPPATIEWE